MKRRKKGQNGPKASKTEDLNCLALFRVRKSTGLQVNNRFFPLTTGVVWGQEEAQLHGEATVALLHKGKKNGIYPKYGRAW